MGLMEALKTYEPFNEQEEHDKAVMIRYLEEHDGCFERSDRIAHFTASVWAVNPSRTKALMVYHNLYKAWSWIGGHSDGERDQCKVALRELMEETGVKNPHLVSNEIFSLEILTVDGHVKRGEYVPSHLHLNVTYLVEVEESEILAIKPDENSGVKWMAVADIAKLAEEPWMTERIYRKLIAKTY